jgi:hypothetical protein
VVDMLAVNPDIICACSRDPKNVVSGRLGGDAELHSRAILNLN